MWQSFTCVAGVGLGGQSGGVGHSGAEEGRRVVHIDLEIIQTSISEGFGHAQYTNKCKEYILTHVKVSRITLSHT